MRPTLTTGDAAANVSTTAICKKTRKKSRILLAPCSAKLSAQSPPCSRKASPAATRPSAFFRLRASPAKTSGGNVASCASTSANALVSGYSGTCSTGLPRQLSGVHRSDIILLLRKRPQPPKGRGAPGYTQAVHGPPVGFRAPEASPCGKSGIRICWILRQHGENRGGRGCDGRRFHRRHHASRGGRIFAERDPVPAARAEAPCRPDQFGHRRAAQDLPGLCRLSGRARLRGPDL